MNTDAKTERLIDASINRLREGLRVIEDIHRYIFDDADLSSAVKNLRHNVQKAYNPHRIIHRDIENDVSKETTESEISREDLNSILIANFSRAEESSRVLEELFKLDSPELSSLFKNIRYGLYALEKKSYLKYLQD